MFYENLLDAPRTTIHELEIALRLVLAALFGGVLGLDREVRDRPAGLRTHMMTSLAAGLFTVITFEIFHTVRSVAHDANVDPIRIIEAVTAGVAFLAAGAIIQTRGHVEGLTTGAGMWMAGAIGVTCGAGYYALAVIATTLAFVILSVLHRLEKKYLNDSKPAAHDD